MSNDSAFLKAIEATLNQVEQYIENLDEMLDLDADTSRAGNVLTMDFADKGKLILNSQVANHELWLAAKSGGYHYKFTGAGWLETKAAEAFELHFVKVLSEQLHQPCEPLTLAL